MFLQRLRKLFKRRNSKKTKKYSSPTQETYSNFDKSFGNSRDNFADIPQRRMMTSIADLTRTRSELIFENQFQVSKTPELRYSKFQGSRPFQQNAIRYRFHVSGSRFRSSRTSQRPFSKPIMNWAPQYQRNYPNEYFNQSGASYVADCDD